MPQRRFMISVIREAVSGVLLSFFNIQRGNVHNVYGETSGRKL